MSFLLQARLLAIAVYASILANSELTGGCFALFLCERIVKIPSHHMGIIVCI